MAATALTHARGVGRHSQTVAQFQISGAMPCNISGWLLSTGVLGEYDLDRSGMPASARIFISACSLD